MEWWQKSARLVVERNIVYASLAGEALHLDVFRPAGDEVLPAVVALVGGGWTKCNKVRFESFCITLASHGYVALNVNYRLAPAHRWPACMLDTKTAVRWARAHARQHGIDAKRVGALGSSAGAHLAAMLAVTSEEKAFDDGPHKEQPSRVSAAVCLCPPVDMTALYEIFHKSAVDVPAVLLGGTPQEAPEAYRSASPVTYINGKSAPCLFIHGTDDKIVPFEPTRQMAERMRQFGVDSEFIALPGVGHGVHDVALTASPVSPMPKILDFLAKHLG